MFLRAAIVMAGVVTAGGPVLAEPMKAEEARRFVAGKLFSFTCFEGSTGSGRIMNDGSVAGVVKMQGSGPVRFMHLPPGTLFPKGDAICSQVKGAFFNPCFNLERTSAHSFRGAVSGFSFAYCDFVRRGSRGELLRASASPEDVSAATGTAAPRPSLRHRAPKPQSAAPAAGASAAAPTQPVTSAPLQPVEQAVIRSTISP
jgi:hypothetical protein